MWKFFLAFSSAVVCNHSQYIAVTKGSCHIDNSVLNASVNALFPQTASFWRHSSSECVLGFYFGSFVDVCFCNLDRWNQQVCNLCKLSGLLSERSFKVYWLQLWFPLQQLQHKDMWMSSLFWKQVPLEQQSDFWKVWIYMNYEVSKKVPQIKKQPSDPKPQRPKKKKVTCEWT